MVIVLYFFNCIVAFRRDATSAPSRSFESNREIFVPLHFGNHEGADVFFNSGVLSFGYDYFSLVLCFMTAVVFSFVFYVTLFNEGIHQKKLFFLILLLVELTTLATFLSLNVLGFLIYFESALFPLAFMVGFWGSSSRR